MMSSELVTAKAEPKSSASINRFTLATLTADVATALVVGCSVAIPISIIDLSIMSKVAGVNKTMAEGLRQGTESLFKSPYNFFIRDKPGRYNALVFQLCVSVYFTTFVTANATRTWNEAEGESKAHTALLAGLCSSFANTAMTAWKDGRMLQALPCGAKAAGAAGAATKTVSHVPMLSRAGFVLRDTLTCMSAFTVVPLLRDSLVHRGWDEQTAKTTASFSTPVAMQVGSTALHIPSIVYQRMYTKDRLWGGPEGYGVAIVKQLKLDYVGALRLRMLRVWAGFGIGTLVTTDLRLALMERFAGEEALTVSV